MNEAATHAPAAPVVSPPVAPPPESVAPPSDATELTSYFLETATEAMAAAPGLEALAVEVAAGLEAQPTAAVIDVSLGLDGLEEFFSVPDEEPAATPSACAMPQPSRLPAPTVAAAAPCTPCDMRAEGATVRAVSSPGLPPPPCAVEPPPAEEEHKLPVDYL